MPSLPAEKKKIAIVGSTVLGLCAVWGLKDTEHEVHIFEPSDRIGGDNDINLRRHSGAVTVDARISIFNETASPNLYAFLKELDISTRYIRSPFTLSRDDGHREWGSSSLFGIFTPHRNIFRLDAWMLLVDIIRFYYFSLDELRDDEAGNHRQETIRDYLKRENYTTHFVEDCLVPMLATLWNFCPETSVLDFPARSIICLVYQSCLFDFLGCNHQWLTIKGSVQKIADAVLQGFPVERIHYDSHVAAITPRAANGSNLIVNGQTEEFDHVIVAEHGDKARDMWLSPGISDARLDFLSSYKTRLMQVIVHSDTTYLPKERHLRSACTYTSQSSAQPPAPNFVASVTYNLNVLHKIPEARYGHILMTVNPFSPPPLRRTDGIKDFIQPVYSAATLEAQRRQPYARPPPEMSYCGLWTSFALSEDGVTSALEIAKDRLGATLPFQLQFPSRDPVPALTRGDEVARVIVRFIHVMFRILRLWLYILGFIGVTDRKEKEP